MICTTIGNRSLDRIEAILNHPLVEMAEVRLDSCLLSAEDIDVLFSESEKPLVATLRLCLPEVQEAEGGMIRDGEVQEAAGGTNSQSPEAAKDRMGMLEAAIRAGASYADIGDDIPQVQRRRLMALCRRCGCRIIRSYHDFEGAGGDLEAILERLSDGDIIKIAVTASNESDINALEELYSLTRKPLIAFSMGEKWSGSRIACLKKGAPFTYARPDASICMEDDSQAGKSAAAGQLGTLEMRRAVYGDNNRAAGHWETQMRCSKSCAQRAIIASALCDGVTILEDYDPCEDSEAALGVAACLGAEIIRDGRTLRITGHAGSPEADTSKRFFCSQSGLLARLMVPIGAALWPEVSIDGEGTLLGRPLKDASDIMASFGVLLYSADGNLKVPLRTRGRLVSGCAEIDGRSGSQLISGLMMALPLCKETSVIYLDNPVSVPYIYLTAGILRYFGIKTDIRRTGTGLKITVRGGQTYRSTRLALEADWSAAAPFMVAGAIFGSATVRHLSLDSSQADAAICDILIDAGAAVSADDDSITVRRGPLLVFDADLTDSPDLFPPVSILAAFSDGKSRIAGLRRLSGKESDRAKVIVEMLGRLGVTCSVNGDILEIEGTALTERILTGKRLHGGHYRSYDDHRIVMALSIASLFADGGIETDNPGCVSKSYPEFLKDFDRIL